jgi:transposase
MQAWRLSKHGWKARDIAFALDVSKGAVSQWLMIARLGGKAALRSRPHPGACPKLKPEQMRLIPDFLGHGSEAYGFRGELWTTARIANVIEEEFGVSYDKSQVSRLLKKLRWTPQVPVIRAVQRDEKEIQRWQQEVWPELKARAVRERRALVFTDESGFYLLPGVVKTYAPMAQPPIINAWLTHDHLSVMGAVTRDAKMYTMVREESFNGLHVEEFLGHLIRHLGPRLLVVWDGSPIHRRVNVREFLSGPQGRRVRIEPLPPYAPDLNPVEGVWQQLKHVELRNVTCLDFEDLHLQLDAAIARLRQKPNLIQSFFQGAGFRTLGCCTSTCPTPVVIVRLGRNPLRTTCRRPCSSRRCLCSASQSSTSCWIISRSIFWAPDRRISVITSRLWGAGKTQRSMLLSRMVAYSLGLVSVTNHFFPKYAAFFNLPRTQLLTISRLWLGPSQGGSKGRQKSAEAIVVVGRRPARSRHWPERAETAGDRKAASPCRRAEQIRPNRRRAFDA